MTPLECLHEAWLSRQSGDEYSCSRWIALAEGRPINLEYAYQQPIWLPDRSEGAPQWMGLKT